MSPFLFTYSALLSVSVLAFILVALTAWRQRAKPSALPMFALCLAICVWAVCYIFEINSTDLQTKLFWANAKYPAVVIVPVALATFLLRFAGWTDWPKPRFLAGLLILPGLTVLAVFTNQSHHLFWSALELQTFPAYASLKSTYGPWFGVYAVYSYLLILISSAMALSALARSWQFYRPQILWLTIGICLPLIVNLISVFGLHPWPGIDLSPAAFGVGALFLLSSNGLTGILDVGPLAHMTLMEQMRDGVLVLDLENRIHELNRAAERILKQTDHDLIGKNVLTIANPAVELLRLYLGDNTIQRDVQIDTAETPEWYDMRISKILTPYGEMVGRLVIWRNITERKQVETELRFASSHDQLTGLYNRMYFETEFRRLRLGRDWPITILMIDLDGLKQTNDTFGHAAGDELIRQTAQILQNVFRKDDLVARIGGDEFSALLPSCDPASARLLVERLYQALADFNQNHPAHRLRFSIGSATAAAGEDLSQALLLADTQLYAEKARRKLADL